MEKICVKNNGRRFVIASPDNIGTWQSQIILYRSLQNTRDLILGLLRPDFVVARNDRMMVVPFL
jgi:hypothetical protein